MMGDVSSRSARIALTKEEIEETKQSLKRQGLYNSVMESLSIMGIPDISCLTYPEFDGIFSRLRSADVLLRELANTFIARRADQFMVSGTDYSAPWQQFVAAREDLAAIKEFSWRE